MAALRAARYLAGMRRSKHRSLAKAASLAWLKAAAAYSWQQRQLFSALQ